MSGNQSSSGDQTPQRHDDQSHGVAVNVLLICVVVIYGMSMLFVVTVWITRKHKRYKIDTRVSLMVQEAQATRENNIDETRKKSRGRRYKRPRHTQRFILKREREVCPAVQECDSQTPSSGGRSPKLRDPCVWFVGSGFSNSDCGIADDGVGEERRREGGENRSKVEHENDTPITQSPSPPKPSTEKRVHFSEQVRANRYSISVYSCADFSLSEQDLGDCLRDSNAPNQEFAFTS